jgi:hypothetical protein
MKLKGDENPGQRGAVLFREAGHEVATAAEQQLISAGGVHVRCVTLEHQRRTDKKPFGACDERYSVPA